MGGATRRRIWIRIAKEGSERIEKPYKTKVYFDMEKIKLEIPIAGVPEEVEIKEIEVDKLVLDEENPRIGYWRDNVMRVTDITSQGDLEMVLKSGDYEDYNRLKRSIETSEGAMEEIWVYPIEKGKYKIIDGNTRVLIYRDLRDKYPHKDYYKNIMAKVLPEDIS